MIERCFVRSAFQLKEDSLRGVQVNLRRYPHSNRLRQHPISNQKGSQKETTRGVHQANTIEQSVLGCPQWRVVQLENNPRFVDSNWLGCKKVILAKSLSIVCSYIVHARLSNKKPARINQRTSELILATYDSPIPTRPFSLNVPLRKPVTKGNLCRTVDTDL